MGIILEEVREDAGFIGPAAGEVEEAPVAFLIREGGLEGGDLSWSGHWDWMRDEKQRAMLLKVRTMGR